MEPIIRIRFIVKIAAGFVVWFLIATISGTPWLICTMLVTFSAWLLFIIYHGYLLLRANWWRQTHQEEKEALTKLAIAPTVKRPEEFGEHIQAIHDAQKRMLSEAPDFQGRFLALGITVSLVPPLALLFLSLQTLFFPHSSSWGAGLVFAEGLLLFYLIWNVWTNPDPTQRWVQARVRAEVLRREQYLCMAAVGPYLQSSSSPSRQVGTNRLDLLVSAEIPQLRQIIPLSTPCDFESSNHGDCRWLDDLWRSADSSVRLPDALERMECYRHYRIGKQKMWFTRSSRLNHGYERWITCALKIAVLIAFAAASIYAALLFEQMDHSSALPKVAHLFGFVLPPLGAAFLALQSLFSFRTLAISYYNTYEELLRLETNLVWLIKRYQTTTDEAEYHRIETEFQALVLHTESILTQEMKTWILLIQRSEYDVGT